MGVKNANVQLKDLGVLPSGFYGFDLVFMTNRTTPVLSIRGSATYGPK